MKLRIIFLSALDIWSINDKVGAPSFYNTITLYTSHGHDVYLIKPFNSHRKNYYIDNLHYVNINTECIESLRKIPKISFFADFIFRAKLTHNFIKQAAVLIESSSIPCLLYAYEVHAVAAAAYLSKKYKVPFISRFQGTILDSKVHNKLFWYLRYNVHYCALRKKANMVIMTDDGTNGLDILKQLGNKTEKIYFWRNGVDDSILSTATDSQASDIRYKMRAYFNFLDNDIILMTLSRLVSWKRVDRAIDALSLLLQQYPNCKLIVIGDGDAKHDLQSRVMRGKIEDNVIFVGQVEQKLLWRYFACADIFLSLYDISNLGNPLMEAMRHGMPIITIDNGNTKSVINNGENGILVNSGEPEIIAEAIKEVINDSELKRRLSLGAVRFAKEKFWTWEERMRTEYRHVMSLVDNFYSHEIL